MNHNIRALISIQNSNEMNFELPIIKRENNEVIFRENNCNNQNDVNNLQLENNAINEQPESQRRSLLIRNNVRSELKAAISESLIINFLSCLLSLSKVAVTTSVLIGEEICNGPLKIWLILMLFNDAFYSFGLILIIKTIVTNDPNSFSRINNPRSRDSVSELDIDLSSVLRRNSFENEETNAFNINYGAERKNSLASRIMEITKLYYIVIFIYGNVIFFTEVICTKETTPTYWGLGVTYLLMGYIYLSIPIFIVISICVCLPIVIVIYFFVSRQGRIHPARRALIESLPRIHFDNTITNKECCICMVEYSTNDEIIELPCNKLHNFHSECIISWLKINGICPICRRSIEIVGNPNNIQEIDDHFPL